MESENNELGVKNRSVEAEFEKVLNGINTLIVTAFIAGLIFKLTQMQM